MGPVEEDMMLKKEFFDTLRALLESSVVLLAIPMMKGVAMLMGFSLPLRELANVIGVATIVAFAGYSGLTLFQGERKDNGFEYLLTLPYSRLRILVTKWLPRFLVLVSLAMLTAGIFNHPMKKWLIFLVIFQLGSLCISLAFETVFPGIIGTIVLGMLLMLGDMFFTNWYYYLKIKALPIPLDYPTYLLGGVLLLIPLAVTFAVVYWKYDLRPYKYVIRPYFYIALPLIAVQVFVYFVYMDRFLKLL